MDDKRIEKLQSKLNELRTELETLDNRSKKNAATASDDHQDGKKKADTAHIKPHRMLIIEFAIENAQTVKKRLERKEKMREKDAKKDETQSKEKTSTGHSNKSADQKNNSRQRTLRVSSTPADKGPIESAEKNSTSKLGRIISQKRKSKKLKHGHK